MTSGGKEPTAAAERIGKFTLVAGSFLSPCLEVSDFVPAVTDCTESLCVPSVCSL